MSAKPPPACIYCGATTDLTKDHIPPECLFPKPRPNNLITVPACRRCNENAHQDDEYLRDILVSHELTGDHPAAQGPREAHGRALINPKGEGLRKRVGRSLVRIDDIRPSGLYAGKRLAMKVDIPRLGRVVSRIVKGLFYHHAGRPLAEGFMVEVPTNQPGPIPPAVAEALEKQPPVRIGEGVFEYRVIIREQTPDATVWLLTFYDSVNFACWTGPRADLVKKI